MAEQQKLSNDALEIARKYDLTEKLMGFLDRHLIFPLLQHLSDAGLYDKPELQQLKYDLFKGTDMVEYTNDLWLTMNNTDTLSAELEEKTKKVQEESQKFETATAKVREVLENQEVLDRLQQDKHENLKLLESKYGVDVNMINELYKYGQFQYNSGKYGPASDLLYNFRALSTDSDLIASATWGKLAADILSLQWESALEELKQLREITDQRSFSDQPFTQLHHRAWIIHWALFPLFNIENGRETLCDIFFSSPYISAIQAACPWILRYLIVAVVSSNKGRTHGANSFQRRLKDLVRVVGQETYEYQDPLTEFIQALYIDYDFEEAQAKLSEAEIILKNDFFVASQTELFMNSARHLISELYCRIHQKIDVAQLSEKLNLNTSQGEKWIANLIQDTKMDAKIDESEGTVIMNHPISSVHKQVIDKTRGVLFRSNQLLNQSNKQDHHIIIQ